jgi:hypothetical protein
VARQNRLRPEILDLEQRADLSPGAVGYDQGAGPGQCLQAGGEVGGFADHAPLLRRTGADQIADDDKTAGDADPHVQWFRGREPADRFDDREPGTRRAFGVILMRLGVAEINEHPIAHILGDKTAKAADGVGDTAMIGADDLAQILGSKRIDSGVDPTRSQNITVSWRRSASAGAVPPLGAMDGVGSGGAAARRAAIASSSRRRSPTKVTPRSFRSSAVRLGSTSASILFSRKACSYCSSRRLRSHSATFIGVVRNRQAAGSITMSARDSVQAHLARRRTRCG